MKFDELTQREWGDGADYFHERDKMDGTTKLMVPSVINLRPGHNAANTAP
jgi:hypothetical protein